MNLCTFFFPYPVSKALYADFIFSGPESDLHRHNFMPSLSQLLAGGALTNSASVWLYRTVFDSISVRKTLAFFIYIDVKRYNFLFIFKRRPWFFQKRQKFTNCHYIEWNRHTRRSSPYHR